MRLDAPSGRAGWNADVLAWYARHEERLNAPAPGPGPASDVIVCMDESLAPAAAALAEWLGRDVQMAPDPGVPWANSDGATSMLLMAGLGQVTSGLARRATEFSVANKTPVGFMIARDAGHAGLLAAKTTFAHRGRGPAADGIIDGGSGYCGDVTERKLVRSETVEAALRADWRVLAVAAHSDQGHMNLGSHSLCGGSEPERVGGQLLAGGCDPALRTCRRMVGTVRQVSAAHLVRAVVIGLMGCRTFDPPGEAYPSSVSLMMGALDGFAAAVVGTLGPLDVGFDSTRALVELLSSGQTLGEAVLALNGAHDISGINYGFALAGDPALRVACTPQPAAENARSPLISRAGTGAAGMGDGPAPGHDADGTLALRPFRTAISRARSAERVARALKSACELSFYTEDGLAEAIDHLLRCQEYVLSTAWDGVGSLSSGLAVGRRNDPAPFHQRLAKAVNRWDEAFLDVAALGGPFQMFAALHEYATFVGSFASGACRRCGSATRGLVYQDPELADVRRVATDCVVCTQISEAAVDGPCDLSLAVDPAPLAAGGEMRVTANLTVRSPGSFGTGALAVMLSDEPTEKMLAGGRHDADETGTLGLCMRIPPHTRNDLHVLWAVWVRDMTVTFAQARVAVAAV